MKLQTWVLHLKTQLAQVNFFQAGGMEGFGICTELQRNILSEKQHQTLYPIFHKDIENFMFWLCC